MEIDLKKWLIYGGPVLLLLVVVVSFFLFTSKSTPSLYPVEGQIFFNNKPAVGAIIWLHPVDPAKPGERIPQGKVEEDGTFHLTTFRKGDGALPGKYRVSISWTKGTQRGDEVGENLLPEHYQDPNQSGLPIVEIKEEPMQLPPFHLTGPPAG